MSRPIKLFFSYSHQDEKLRDELAKRLSTLRRNKVIADWHDRQIGAGQNWAQAIEDNLKSADIILLLVSADFLHSEFCSEVELRQAMERHAAGEACVIPIILRPCYWQDEPFAALQALPKNAEPITSWSDRDAAFLNVELGIRAAIAQLRETQKKTSEIKAVNDEILADFTESQAGIDQSFAEIAETKPLNEQNFAEITEIKPLNEQNFAEITETKPLNDRELSSIDKRLELQTFSFDIITVNDRGTEIDRRPGEAKYFREELESGVFLDMVSIPGGTFWMGEGDSRKEVEVEPFFMGKFAVTQAQWKAIAKLPKVDRSLDLDPSHFKGNDRPVECVSWNDAIEFCKRLNQKTGQHYRLPSGAEWEYACRAGTTTPFHFGETITSSLVNYDGSRTFANEPRGEWRRQTIEVGSLPPNAFGLYEMHGNVGEWCRDRDVNLQPICGAAWNGHPWNCCSAIRDWNRRDIFDRRRGCRLALPCPRTF